MAKNRSLHAASRAKKDEFYTQLYDIENELRHYRAHFRDKVVYCNCDDPTVSNFYRFFKLNFEFLGLKKLITTCYKSQQMDMFSQHDIDTAIGIEYTGKQASKQAKNTYSISRAMAISAAPSALSSSSKPTSWLRIRPFRCFGSMWRS